MLGYNTEPEVKSTDIESDVLTQITILLLAAELHAAH